MRWYYSLRVEPLWRRQLVELTSGLVGPRRIALLPRHLLQIPTIAHWLGMKSPGVEKDLVSYNTVYMLSGGHVLCYTVVNMYGTDTTWCNRTPGGQVFVSFCGVYLNWRLVPVILCHVAGRSAG
jgi:hypothetical protein